MTPDAGIFQHIGWFLTRGARLYADAWEVKPPLSFETTGILALLAGGDVYLLHLLSVLLMMVVACSIVGLVAALVWHSTRDRFAASIAGFSMFLLPGFLVRPAYGFKAKYMVLFAGLVAIYAYTRGYPALSGAAAAASVGYWQAAIIFPCLVVGMALRDGDRTNLVRTVAGGVAFTAAMLLPVYLLWNSTSEMLVQAVLVPLTVGESTPLLNRLAGGVIHFKWASPFVLLGAAGLVRVAVDVLTDRNDPIGRDEWWILAGGAWFGFFILFVDFEVGGYTDLIPCLGFLAIGVGVVAARLDDARRRRYLGGAIAAVLVVNIVLLGSLGLVFSPVETPGPVPMEDLQTNDRAEEVEAVGSVPEVRYIYWNRIEPSTCHYRLSVMEVQWLEKTKPYSGQSCMDFATARKALGSG
ncbi:DolP-mannose mannosyltransferase [Halopelagius fulvigenes]|uniref:DolP-mannose mannosyltransferase n=2 Tax=Halopelagius fulvigenes TaxID=1198324 RepID=A0ABD5TXC7_9EURY